MTIMAWFEDFHRETITKSLDPLNYKLKWFKRVVKHSNLKCSLKLKDLDLCRDIGAVQKWQVSIYVSK